MNACKSGEDRWPIRVSSKSHAMARCRRNSVKDMLNLFYDPVDRAKIYSTNPVERLNGERKRRSEVVGIFPNEAAVLRPIGALLLEQNDAWAVQRARYMTLETITPLSDVSDLWARFRRLPRSEMVAAGGFEPPTKGL
ncbi:transposase [Limobrevibacterium gyesilva]|uniref:Mutator family transposase n=1 Tax=Limobrevibacterium gyesilva TaxID=2991712 RepID=A0AA41YR30_9PROT|nr:transposase [Limobrevibacterium gyesilva]MCW3476743.1 transposase [Limobrevibacterium gyesilva]